MMDRARSASGSAGHDLDHKGNSRCEISARTVSAHGDSLAIDAKRSMRCTTGRQEASSVAAGYLCPARPIIDGNN
jgi:hypothetical protein